MPPLAVLPCRALLFDCDGVLVDSEEIVVRPWARWAVRYGLDPDEVTPMVHGRRSIDTVRLLIGPSDRAEALRTIDAYELEDAAQVGNVAGASRLLSSLPPDAWAIVTSGTAALARARLSAAGIPLPAVVITADDVSHGKPHPEGYLAAACALDVPPAMAIVIEDSASGVEAGRRAGAAAVVGVGTKALESEADVVVRDLNAVAWTGSGLAIHQIGVLRPVRRPSGGR